MQTAYLRMYFRAGVLVPFMASCAISIFLLLVKFIYVSFTLNDITPDTELYSILRISFHSGIVGLSCFTIFLNRSRKIVQHPLFSVLSWYLLPVLVITWMIMNHVNLRAINTENKIDDLATALYFTIFMFHLIGMSISFVDFRKSVVLGRGMRKPPAETAKNYEALRQEPVN